MIKLKNAVSILIIIQIFIFQNALAYNSDEANKLAATIDKKYGGDANRYNHEKTGIFSNPPIFKFVKKERTDLIEVMLDKGFDLNNQDEYYYYALHFAFSEDKPNIAKFLLEKGATIEAVEKAAAGGDIKHTDGIKSGDSPLFSAVYHDSEELVTLVLENGGSFFAGSRYRVVCCEYGDAGIAHARYSAKKWDKPSALRAFNLYDEKKRAEQERIAAEKKRIAAEEKAKRESSPEYILHQQRLAASQVANQRYNDFKYSEFFPLTLQRKVDERKCPDESPVASMYAEPRIYWNVVDQYIEQANCLTNVLNNYDPNPLYRQLKVLRAIEARLWEDTYEVTRLNIDRWLDTSNSIIEDIRLYRERAELWAKRAEEQEVKFAESRARSEAERARRRALIMDLARMNNEMADYAKNAQQNLNQYIKDSNVSNSRSNTANNANSVFIPVRPKKLNSELTKIEEKITSKQSEATSQKQQSDLEIESAEAENKMLLAQEEQARKEKEEELRKKRLENSTYVSLGTSEFCFKKSSALDLAETEAKNEAHMMCREKENNANLDEDRLFYFDQQCRPDKCPSEQVRCDTKLQFYCK